MSNQTHFFATKSDLLQVLHEIESTINLKYVLSTPVWPWARDKVVFNSLKDYPNLGTNKTGKQQLGDCFFVFNIQSPVNFRKTFLFFPKYAVDNQINNPNSIVLWPGGLYKKQFLISGHVGTAASEKESIDLYQYFSKILIKHFQKVKSYYVGKEALMLYKDGCRLITMSVAEPVEYDLSIN